MEEVRLPEGTKISLGKETKNLLESMEAARLSHDWETYKIQAESYQLLTENREKKGSERLKTVATVGEFAFFVLWSERHVIPSLIAKVIGHIL